MKDNGLKLKPSVAVLMCTHNGQKFVSEQIASILLQSHDNLHVYIRDDGSSDGTVDTIKKVRREIGRSIPLRLIRGQHVGLPETYFRLMREVDLSHEYYAFADQDDVWSIHKIERALEFLTRFNRETPLLYFCRQQFVNHNLSPLGLSAIVKKPCLANALIQNPAKGCTQVFNRAALSILREAMPCGVRWHDWWVYLTIAAFGTVVFDSRVGILYRIHEGSTVGESANLSEQFIKRIRRFLRRDGTLFQARHQARVFLELCGSKLSNEKRTMISRFAYSDASLRHRIHYALTSDVKRHTPWETAFFRFFIAMGLD